MLARQVRGEPFGGAQDVRRSYGSEIRSGTPRFDLVDGCVLVDVDTDAFDGRGQPAGQFGGMDLGAVRVPDTTQGSGDIHPARRFGCGQQRAVGTGPRRQGLRHRLQAPELGRGVGDGQFAALADIGVDTLFGCDGEHFVDRRVQRVLVVDRRLPTVGFRHPLTAAGDLVGEPAAVAPGCPETGEPCLQDRDAQTRFRFLEVVRGPQPGVAGPDDGDVDIDRPGQRSARRGQPDLLPPEGNSTIDGHDVTPLTRSIRWFIGCLRRLATRGPRRVRGPASR